MLLSKYGKDAVLGIYPTHELLDTALEHLRASGFSNADISVLMPRPGEAAELADEQNFEALDSVSTSATGFALLGGSLGWLVGMGTLAIPGVGLFVAAGPVMAAIAGMSVGGAVGGIAGALAGTGISEPKAKHFEGLVKSGGYLLSVHVDHAAQADVAIQILQSTGARDISHPVVAHSSEIAYPLQTERRTPFSEQNL